MKLTLREFWESKEGRAILVDQSNWQNQQVSTYYYLSHVGLRLDGVK